MPYLIRILGRRAFLAFAAVTLVVVFLLSAIQVASRYALKQYVEDQLARISWDISVYQTNDLNLAEEAGKRIRQLPHVTETQNIIFLRTSVPATTLAYVDDEPMRSPWLSMLSVTDPALLPAGMRPTGDGAILILVGSKAQMGDAFLQLQNKKKFELRVDKDHGGGKVFNVPLDRVVRLDRNELNQWFMDQTSSPAMIPELGVILLTPYDQKRLAAFDAVSRGIEHHHDEHDPAETGRGDPIHASAGDYFPDIIHLARVDRRALVSGWDVEASSRNLARLSQEVREAAQEVTFRIGVDSTSAVLLERMNKTARVVALVGLLAALPLVWIAWLLLANLSSLLLLNERRKFGLLRLRGVPGRLLGQSMQIAIGAGGLLGGLIGALLGTAIPILFYARSWLPWETIAKIQDPLMLAVSLAIGVGLAMVVSRRLVRYAATISPLEASGRIAASESSQTTVRFGLLQMIILLLGSVKVAGWITGWSFVGPDSPAWLHTADRALDFVAFPFFVYGATTLLASRRRWMEGALRPIVSLLGGRMGGVSLQHTGTRPHRGSGMLLIVTLMTSLSLYPTIMTAAFDNKLERAALVQLGAPLQITLSAPDLVPASVLAKNGLNEREALLREQARKVLAKVRGLKEVRSAGYMLEGLVDGVYMPGKGFSSIPLYLLDGPAVHLENFYHEQALGNSEPYSKLIGQTASGQMLVSSTMANFWQPAVGREMPVGRNTSGAMATAPVAGTLHFMPGMPMGTVKDRESFVGARVDYLNHLFDNRSYMVSSIGNPKLATADVLMQRVVLTVVPSEGTETAALKKAVVAALPADPLQVRELRDEVTRLGSDMYIFLARQNVQIYLLGGVLMALIGILAMALANHAEDRRTLGLLRIRGAGPREIRQFHSGGLSAPAILGLLFGAVMSLLVGYGITNLIWKLREIKTIMLYLRTYPAASWQTAAVAALLLLMVFGILFFLSRWIFQRTAREGLSD